jgi:hypothetical protein
LGQEFEGIHELGHDAENAPGIFLDKSDFGVVVHVGPEFRGRGLRLKGGISIHVAEA